VAGRAYWSINKVVANSPQEGVAARLRAAVVVVAACRQLASSEGANAAYDDFDDLG